ncbi:glycosyltransferase [Pelagibacteraceae bacterium]|jgi:glycosyltransferase involved in cell wall biosynthesis|nr:glycosyltransferase [Pelagibacteraceae bacterium]
MKKKLFIFSNESIHFEDNKFYCDNLDLKSTPEGLNKNFEINLFGRKSVIKRSHEIKIKKIQIFNNIISYVSSAIAASKDQNAKFLIISISPYTFLVALLIKLLGKKPIIYLRSDGYGEYKAILGKIGPIIYHLMFSISAAISHLISCRHYILREKKGKVLSPSQLDSTWLRQPKNTEIKDFKLLYVGRVRVEKGIYSLAELIRNKRDIFLTIVGAEKGKFYGINQSNINIHATQNNKIKLIKYYDDHNIFILPSFTEGHPMVLLEALARRRPVIIFDDIKHVIGDKKGIFVTKRNFLSLLGTLNNIKKNYKKIQKDMRKNKLPTNKEFIDRFVKLIGEF